LILLNKQHFKRNEVIEKFFGSKDDSKTSVMDFTPTIVGTAATDDGLTKTGME
jgi:hypothetical protein